MSCSNWGESHLPCWLLAWASSLISLRLPPFFVMSLLPPSNRQWCAQGLPNLSSIMLSFMCVSWIQWQINLFTPVICNIQNIISKDHIPKPFLPPFKWLLFILIVPQVYGLRGNRLTLGTGKHLCFSVMQCGYLSQIQIRKKKCQESIDKFCTIFFCFRKVYYIPLTKWSSHYLCTNKVLKWH